MKITIAGVGHLGSEVAMMCAIFFSPERIMLYDKIDLSGHILDLQHACKGLGVKTLITDKIGEADYTIITAGAPYKSAEEEHSKEFYSSNLKVVEEVMLRLKATESPTKLIIMTNPVVEITEELNRLHPSMQILNPEKYLVEMRDGKELGMEIIKTKGYTNFGAAVSCAKLIAELEGKSIAHAQGAK